MFKKTKSFNLCTYTIMDLIKFIIIATIITILLGCFFLANTDTIANYFSSTSLSEYNRYDIRLMDENDINYIKWIIPGVQIPDNDTQYPSTKIINPTIDVSPSTNPFIPHSVDSSGKETSENTKTKSPKPNNSDPNRSYPEYKCSKCPNMSIPDSQLGLDTDKSRNFGIELPWDKEIGFCDVLKGSDRDLYKNLQDSSIITFY